jgi:hypothetical protein
MMRLESDQCPVCRYRDVTRYVIYSLLVPLYERCLRVC